MKKLLSLGFIFLFVGAVSAQQLTGYPPPGQLPGTATNDSAAAGNVGELLSAQTGVGAPITLTNNTSATIASVTLTPGNWDLSCIGKFLTAATTTVTQLGVNVTTGTTYGVTAATSNEMQFASFAPGAAWLSLLSPTVNVSVNVGTTYNCVILGTFSTSTLSGAGALRARRVR